MLTVRRFTGRSIGDDGRTVAQKDRYRGETVTQEPTGPVEPLRAVADREVAAYWQLTVIGAAENEVRDIRGRDLVAAVEAAWRPVSMARRRLTRALASDDADLIVVAEHQLRRHRSQARRIAAAAIHEHTALLRARLQHEDELRAQYRRVSGALDSALLAERGRGEPYSPA